MYLLRSFTTGGFVARLRVGSLRDGCDNRGDKGVLANGVRMRQATVRACPSEGIGETFDPKNPTSAGPCEPLPRGPSTLCRSFRKMTPASRAARNAWW